MGSVPQSRHTTYLHTEHGDVYPHYQRLVLRAVTLHIYITRWCVSLLSATIPQGRHTAYLQNTVMCILIISNYSSEPSHCIPTEHGDVYPHYQRLFWPGSNSFVHLTYIYRRKNFTFFFSEARLFTVRYAWFSVCSSSLTLNWTQRIISVAELLKAPGLFNFRGCERSSSGSTRKGGG